MTVPDLDYREVGDETPNLFLLRPNKVDYRRIEEQHDWYRAGGDCICERCGMKYYDHPPVIGWTWLKRICNGDLVKL